jgi:hypothetical protein
MLAPFLPPDAAGGLYSNQRSRSPAAADPLTKPQIPRRASWSYDGYCQRRRALAQDLCGVLFAALLRTCSKSAALQRYGVENELKMLMYHSYIPLFRSFSPCLALARKTLNRL